MFFEITKLPTIKTMSENMNLCTFCDCIALSFLVIQKDGQIQTKICSSCKAKHETYKHLKKCDYCPQYSLDSVNIISTQYKGDSFFVSQICQSCKFIHSKVIVSCNQCNNLLFTKDFLPTTMNIISSTSSETKIYCPDCKQSLFINQMGEPTSSVVFPMKNNGLVF